MPSYAMRVARRGKKTTSMFSPGTHMSSLSYATGDLPEKCQIGINSVDPLYWNTHAFPQHLLLGLLKPPGNKFHRIVLKEVLWKQGEGVCAGSRRDNIHAGIYRSKLDFY